MSETITFQPGPVPRGLTPAPTYEVPRQGAATRGGGRFGLGEPAPSTGPVYLTGTPATGGYQGPASGTDGLAIAALVLGLLGVFPLAVVLGHAALIRVNRSGRSGRGLAVAGLVLGYLSLAVTAALVAFGGLTGLLTAVTLG